MKDKIEEALNEFDEFGFATQAVVVAIKGNKVEVNEEVNMLEEYERNFEFAAIIPEGADIKDWIDEFLDVFSSLKEDTIEDLVKKIQDIGEFTYASNEYTLQTFKKVGIMNITPYGSQNGKNYAVLLLKGSSCLLKTNFESYNGELVVDMNNFDYKDKDEKEIKKALSMLLENIKGDIK